jgi:ABC-2 type transport system permease protein
VNAASQWIALRTIITKEFLRFIRIWKQTVLPPMITTGLYFIIFGNLIGTRIGTMDGYAYIDFIVPGLILMAVITQSYSNTVSSFYMAKFQRHIEEMMVSPTPNYIIILGYTGGGIARGLIVGIAVTAVSMMFTQLNINNLAVLLSIVTLTATLFSLAGIINAVYAKTFDDISIIPTFILTPLTYLGGIFYSISLLPEFWQNISLANPILYMINAFRYGFIGVSDINLWTSYGIILMFIIGLYLYCLNLLNKGVGIRS